MSGHRKEGCLAALGEVPDPEACLDAMAIIPMPRPLGQIIEAGQRRGEIASDIDRLKTASIAVTMLLYCVVRYPAAKRRWPADTVSRLLLRGILAQNAQDTL